MLLKANPMILSQLPRHREVQSAPIKRAAWTSLVAQWLRICLPMQGTRVRTLVREDLTHRGATRPVRQNY